MSLEGGIERELPCGKGLLRSTLVDVVRRQVCDPAVAMLGVVPREEGPAESLGGFLAGETRGETRVVLEGLELGLGEGIVVADVGPAEGLGESQIGEQLSRALVAVIGEPRSLCRVRTSGLTSCLQHVSSMRRPARLAFSRGASIQPTT